MATSVIEGNVDVMHDLAQEALDEGVKAQEILNDGLMVGMN
ncbi:MAG: B12-binding domain-containing protein, partial [Chloroflexota bacterium]